MLWNGKRFVGLCLVPWYMILWKDVLEANPAVGTHRVLCTWMEPFSHEPRRLFGSTRALAEHGLCWAEVPWARAGGCLGLEQSRVSASGMLLHTSVCGQIILGSPKMWWWFAWMDGQEACLGKVLWCCRTWPCLDRQRETCATSLFPGVAAKAPEKLLYVNSLVFWQFCTITSCLYRLSQTVSASVCSLGFLLLLFFLSWKHLIRILFFSCCNFSETFYSFLSICMESQDYKNLLLHWKCCAVRLEAADIVLSFLLLLYDLEKCRF